MAKKVIFTRPSRRLFVESMSSRDQVMGVVCTPPLEGGTTPTFPPAREEVKKKLLELTAQERKELLDEVAAEQLLVRNSPTQLKERDVAMWAEAVQTALQDAIGSSLVDMPGVGVLKRLLGASSSWQHVAQFMEGSGLQKGTVQDRQRSYHLLASLLVAHARSVSRRSGAPLGPKLVSTCAVNLPGVFDAAFPGYLASGLARMVVRSHAEVQ